MNHNDFKSANQTLDRFSLFLMALLFVASGQLASAQVSASISGRIEDPSGAAISGAAVTVTSLETGATRTTAGDEAGNYRVLSLPVGRYELKVEKEGFKAVVQTGINLVVGQQAVVNLRLELGAMEQKVTVTAEAPVVNTSTASVSGLVGEQQVKDLPLNGRSFDNLITLTTGAVNFSTVTSGSGGGSNWFAVSGRRFEQTTYLLNGVEMTGAGLQTMEPDSASGSMLGIDAVREFNVLTDSYSAQYGKRPGAQVTIVTQSGTNQLHGSLFEFLRNSDLDGRNFFDRGTIPPFKRNQFGGALGGPIQKDKTFIFGNYEGFRQRLAVSNVTIVPDLNARQGLLPCGSITPAPSPCPASGYALVPGLQSGMLPYTALWPLPNGRNLGGGFAESFNHPLQTIREDYGTVRLDHTFSDKDSVSGNYAIDDGFKINPSPDPLFHGITGARSQIASVQELHIFSPQTINTARVGFSRSFLSTDTPPVTPFPPSLSFIGGFYPGALTIGGVAGGGGSAGGGSLTAVGGVGVQQFFIRNLFTYTDDIQRIHGKHHFTFGAWVQRLRENRAGASQKAGSVAFTSLTTFLQGTVSNFLGNANPHELGDRLLMGAWYVQDTIALRPNLTLNLGLRHEFNNSWNEAFGRLANYIPGPDGVLETTPLIGSLFTQNNAKWLFNPRAALAWDVFGNGKTSIRVGGGIYHQLQDELAFIPDKNPPYNGSVTFGSNTAFLPLVPVTPGVQPQACGPGVPSPCTVYAPFGVQPDMQIPTVYEWNFQVQQQITSNTAVRAAYVGSRAIHQLVGVDLNSIHPQICSNPSGCVSGGVNRVTGSVPQGAEYIPVGTRLNPYLGGGYFWNSEGNANYNSLQLELSRRFSQGLQFRANYTWSKSMDSGASFFAGAAANSGQTILNPYNLSRDWGPTNVDITHQASLSGSYELPLGRGKPWLSGVSGAGDKLVSGWQINWIVTLLSGFPITPLAGANQSGNGNTLNPDRPSVNPAFTGPIIEGTPTQWFNPKAFLLPVSGTWGNLGRATLRGPGLQGVDLSLFKTTAITERLKLEFRAEVFNILNHANFSWPNETVFSGSAISASAGLITATATSSRQIQFGLKLSF